MVVSDLQEEEGVWLCGCQDGGYVYKCCILELVQDGEEWVWCKCGQVWVLEVYDEACWPCG